MELAARRANHFGQPPLDREMDILVRDIELELAGRYLALDRGEPAHDLSHLGIADQANLGEHPGMCDRSLDVVMIEPPIKRQRRGERLDFGQPRLLEAPAN